VSWYQKKHSPTHTYHHHQRSFAFCTISVWVCWSIWNTPLRTPYILSPNHYLLFATYTPTIIVVPRERLCPAIVVSLSSLLGTIFFTLTSQCKNKYLHNINIFSNLEWHKMHGRAYGSADDSVKGFLLRMTASSPRWRAVSAVTVNLPRLLPTRSLTRIYNRSPALINQCIVHNTHCRNHQVDNVLYMCTMYCFMLTALYTNLTVRTGMVN